MNNEVSLNTKKPFPIKRILKALLYAMPVILIEIFVYFAWQNGIEKDDRIFIILCHVIAALSIVISALKTKIHIVFKWIMVVVSPFASFLLLEYITHNPFDLNFDILLFNVSFFFAAALFLIFLTGRTAPAIIIVTAIPVLFGLISYYTSIFRGAPLFPWDLASYGIAATVVGNYDINFTPKIVFIIASAIIIIQIAAMWSIRVRFSFKAIRPTCALLALSGLTVLGIYVQTDSAVNDFRLYPYLFTPNVLYENNGFTVSFLMNLRYTTVEKPKGYNRGEISALSDEITSDSIKKAKKKPNIIVIMNESFADMSALCDFETSDEYLPFISSLDENTVKGDAHVSVVGGNTPNSEFEFLCGLTMGFLPSGSIAYQQFIKNPSPSLAKQLGDLGYKTVAMHPYNASGWKRDEIYPLLGFDQTYFLESFSDSIYIRNYVSDKSVYDKIINMASTKKENEPLFAFAVTMQNHGGYSSVSYNFKPYIHVNGLEGNYSVSTYMSLIRESDAAFEGLINSFKDFDEPTIVVMFGDHQPNDSIAKPLLNTFGGQYSQDDIEGSEKRYIVPYIIWSNYDIEDIEIGDTSLNYLAGKVLDIAGLPLTAAQKYQFELFEEYPVITSRCFINKNGEISPVSSYNLVDSLLTYASLQYNYLFDSGNMPEKFWSLSD